MQQAFEKIADVAVYRNDSTYTAPLGSVEILGPTEVVVSFREADRRRFRSHIDPTSRAVLVRSTDGARSFDPRTAVTIYRGGGGVQDPSVRRTRDGELIASFFVWKTGTVAEVPADCPPGRLTRKGWDGVHSAWTGGTYTVRSRDGGRTWEGSPSKVLCELKDAALTSDPVLELSDGELLIPLYGKRREESDVVAVMRSRDKGRSWSELTVVASDPLGNVSFGEPSLAELATGEILCMMRAQRNDDGQGWSDGGSPSYLYQARSTDTGRTWEATSRSPIWGHPPHLLRLRSGALLCAYGHRRPPFGVHVCLSRDSGRSWDIQREFVLTREPTNFDFGYPSSVQLPDGTIFTAWYHGCDGTARIDGALYRETGG